jgi:hypothetical protein
MKKYLLIGTWRLLLIVGFVTFQSFAYTDCYLQFNNGINAAQAEYQSDVRRCRFAWPAGLCMPEAALSFDKAIDDAIEAFEECMR